MTALQSERPPTAAGFAPVLAANALPLVGVLALGWDPATLAVIYVLEVLVSFPLAAVTALFAQQPPRADHEGGVISVGSDLVNKRGAVEVASWLPPVHPRAVPFAASVLEGGVMFSVFIGAVLASVIRVPVAGVLARPEVALSVAGLVVGQSVETWRTYFRGHRYEEVTPYAVVETPARQTFFLFFVLLLVGGGADATVGLAALVAVKLLVEWSAYRARQDTAEGRLTAWLAGPDSTAEDPDPIAMPDGEPDARIRTDGRAALLDAVLGTLVGRAPFYVLWLLLVWLGSVAALGGGGATRALGVGVGVAVLGLFGLLLASRVVLSYLECGRLEYRRYGDRIVAYDTLVEEPQWATPVDVLRDASVVPDSLPDRLFGTRTIGVTTGWGEDERRRLVGPVAAAEGLVAALSVPVETDLEPIDRRIVALVAAAAVAALAFWVAALVADRGEAVIEGAFLLPFAVFGLRALWWRAYPGRSERAAE